MKPYDQNLCNIEISSFNKGSFFKQLDYYKSRFSRFNVIFNLDNYNNFEELKSMIDAISSAGIPETLCNFMIDIKKRVFTKQEYNNLLKLCDYLDTKSSVLFFKELNVLWFDTEFKNAYKQIYSIVDDVQDKILSPLEQLLYFYKKTANHIYNQEKPFEAKIISRSIIGVHNTGTIVCSGYAELLTAYCETLNDPNIKCYSTPVNLYAKNTGEYQNSHCFNIIYLNDPKYNINGYYLLDSCWDSIKTIDDNMKLSYFLLPLNDINAYADFTLKGMSNNKFFSFFEKQKFFLSSDIKDLYEVLSTQKIFDIKQERELFKKKVVEQYLKYNHNTHPQKVKEIQASIDSKSGQYEQTFLRNMINKILKESSVVDYDSISKALYNMCVYGENMDHLSAHKYTQAVINDTKQHSYICFDETATNCFTVEERESRKQTKAFIERQRARRQQLALKRAQHKNTDTTYE